MKFNKVSKIALCIYGRYNNRLSPKSGDDGTHYIKKTLLADKQMDVFLHSWGPKKQGYLESQYYGNLKGSMFLEPKLFKNDINRHCIDESQFQNPNRDQFRTIENSLSFFYGRKMVIEL